MQCSKKRPLVVIVPFPTDQSVLCDLQEFFQVCFQTLNLKGIYMIWTVMLIIIFISIIVVFLYFGRFLAENILSINLKVHFFYGLLSIMEYYQ